MRVLMVSLDASLLTNHPAGDVLERMREYAKRVDRLDVLIFSPHFGVKRVNEHLRIIGSGGLFKFMRFFLGWRDAVRLVRGKDVVTVQDPFFAGWVGWRASQKNNVPLVIDVHGDFFGDAWRRQHRIRRFFFLRLAKFLLTKATLIRVVNPEIKDDVQRIEGVAAGSVYFLPVPVAVDRFKQCDAEFVKSIKEENNGSPLLLFVGRLVKEKGVQYLIEALKVLKGESANVKLLIVGEGPYRSTLEKCVQDKTLEDSVRFTGEVSSKAMPNYYHACDIVVLPSLHESWGRVIIEAAMAKKPIVAHETVGSLYYRDAHSVYLYDHPQILADTIKNAWADQSGRTETGEDLYNAISGAYDEKGAYDKVIELWKKAVQ